MRQAATEDVAEILRMGELFFNSNVWPEGVFFNKESAELTAHNLIENEDSIIIIDEGGMIAGMVFPFYFTGEIAGQELFWWVDEERRGSLGLRLITALENWARGRGAKHFSMVALEAGSPEKISRVYERRGYLAMEHHFMRAL